MKKENKKPTIKIVLISLIGILVIFFLWAMSSRNSLVKYQENVKNAWADVLVQYQRRTDLIPNLVATVQAYADRETQTFKQVTEARAMVTSFNIDENVLNNPELFQKFQTIQGDLSSALSRLIAVSENYPNLKSSESFLQLQSQLEGTENRIAVSRSDFNKATGTYNMIVKSFPQNIVASISNFNEMPYFAADPGSEKAPVINFDNTTK